MSRIPRLAPHELDAEQQRLYTAITAGDRARGRQFFPLTDREGRLEGPFNAMLLNPSIGDALQRLGAAIRYGGRLPTRCREIAILAVAAQGLGNGIPDELRAVITQALGSSTTSPGRRADSLASASRASAALRAAASETPCAPRSAS